MVNRKSSGSYLTSKAAKALQDKTTSAVQKTLAASLLAQYHNTKQTGAKMEDLASRVLQSDKYSDQTKSFAASVLSQSNKER